MPKIEPLISIVYQVGIEKHSFVTPRSQIRKELKKRCILTSQVVKMELFLS